MLRLESGMVFKDFDGDILRLDKPVPGDGSKWSADIWSDHCKAFLAESVEVEPSDLAERLLEMERLT